MSIIRILLQIIIFKAKPSDVPFNINATTIAFACAWLIQLWAASLQPEFPNPVFFTFIQIVIYGAMISFFLKINKKQARIYQSLLAIFGTLTIISVFIFISTNIGLTTLFIYFAIWRFSVQVYILKHSLETGFGQALFMIITIELTAIFAISLFFPEHMKTFIEALQQAQNQS